MGPWGSLFTRTLLLKEARANSYSLETEDSELRVGTLNKFIHSSSELECSLNGNKRGLFDVIWGIMIYY